eukprot:SAG31_NODE_51_length_30464_cov_16.835628_1_plen_313_part_10
MKHVASGFAAAIFALLGTPVLGLCDRLSETYNDFLSDYVTVVHAVGGCNYARGCSSTCLATQVRLRDNACFQEYINSHSYLCPSLLELGERCGSNLSKHCQDSIDIWPRVHESQTLAVVGSFPKQSKPLIRLLVRKGLATSTEYDSECEIPNEDRVELYAGSSSYRLPIESELQVDPEPAFYFTSVGRNGPSLHTMKHGLSVSYSVPASFRLIQVDTNDVDVVFGVTVGGCLSSLHTVQNDDVAFSLCRFSKFTGVVETIRTWSSDWSCITTAAASALNPVDRGYYFVVYHEASDTTSLAEVQFGSSNVGTQL